MKRSYSSTSTNESSVAESRTRQPSSSNSWISTWTSKEEELVNCSVEAADLNLSEQQRLVLLQVFKLVISRKNGRPFHLDNELFITGGAGSGKSFLLRAIVRVAKRLNINTLVVAHQGVAALNIDGSTICSVFKPHQRYVSNADREMYANLQLLIVDEISMVSSEMLDNTIANRIKEWQRSIRNFGKTTVVVLGDLMQLAPVGKEARPVFRSTLWRKFEMLNLTENHRQHDAEFIENLNLLRWGSVECVPYFNTLLLTPAERQAWSDVTHLMATNRAVHLHNVTKFNRLVTSSPSSVEIICTDIREDKPSKVRDGWTKYPSRTDALAQLGMEIKVCEGTVVLFTSNDLPFMRFCNGDIGTVTRIDPVKAPSQDRVLHVLMNRTGQEVLVEPILVSYDDGRVRTQGVVGNLKGYPITYGWAITIHKSQGISLDKVVVDPKGIFAPAQLYVALSRARTPEGLRLMNKIDSRHIKVDYEAASEYIRLSESGEKANNLVEPTLEPLEAEWFEEPFETLPNLSSSTTKLESGPKVSPSSSSLEEEAQDFDGFFV